MFGVTSDYGSVCITAMQDDISMCDRPSGGLAALLNSGMRTLLQSFLYCVNNRCMAGFLDCWRQSVGFQCLFAV